MSGRRKQAPGATPGIAWSGASRGTVETDRGPQPFTAAVVAGTVWVRFAGRTHVLGAQAARGGAAVASRPDANEPTSPMPGVVLAVAAAEGARVARGDLLVTIEAMKMEHEIRAAAAGRVARVHVREGQRVEAGTKLCTLRAAEGGEP